MITAIRESNEDVGGRTLELAGHEYVIRGRGYIEDLDDMCPTVQNGWSGRNCVLIHKICYFEPAGNYFSSSPRRVGCLCSVQQQNQHLT